MPCACKKPRKIFFFLLIFMALKVMGIGTLFLTKPKFLFLSKSYGFQPPVPSPQPPAAFLTWSSRVSFSSSLKLTKIAPLVNTIMEVKHTRAQLASNSWSVYFSRRCLGLQLTASHCPTLTAERKSRKGWESFYILSSEELPS